MSSLYKRFIEIGHSQSDSDEEKLKKSSLLTMAAPFAIAGLIWGILYFSVGLTFSGYIPFTYGLLSVLSIFHFAKTKKYLFFRNSQLFLILLLPFLLQLSLGGFSPSSAVIMWALIAPAGALVFFSPKQAIYWFAAFLGLVILAYLLNDEVGKIFAWDIDEAFINALFLLNIFGLSIIVFMIQYYFVAKQKQLKAAIEEKNDALKEQAEQLLEMDAVKSRFFANISHEFRTPLTLILGLLSRSQKSESQVISQKDKLSMQRNAKRLLQLINQLLDLSKLESGEIKLKAAKDDFFPFIKRIIFLFESLAGEKNIMLSLNGKAPDKLESPIIEFYFDHEKVQKIVSNLLSNAIKFTPIKGKIDIEVGLIDNKLVQFSIANSGEGIPKEKIAYVFDRFFQVDSDSTREYEGTGIGLALVKELSELHKGSIEASSSTERTRFTLKLPYSDTYLSDDEKIETPIIEEEIVMESYESFQTSNKSENKPNESDEKKLDILVVEDNSDLRNYISTILNEDYNVAQAVDGKDGLDKAIEQIPDLIVSDVMMPNMDGYEFCSHIKTNANTNHIPVILLTAKASQENKLEGLETGADDYLIKPFDENELKIRIRNLISIREKLQQKYQKDVWLKPKKSQLNTVHQQFLDNLKEAVERNLDNPQFSVDDLGSEVAMSRSQVHRKLKAISDQSASAFIRNYRLYRAAELLSEGNSNVTEIAYLVGFSSQTYFSSSFQELFHCSPSEYRVQ